MIIYLTCSAIKKRTNMRKNIVHIVDKQYNEEYLTPIKLFLMYNLSINVRLCLDITKSVFKSAVNQDGNFKFYPPKLYDYEILA